MNKLKEILTIFKMSGIKKKWKKYKIFSYNKNKNKAKNSNFILKLIKITN